MCASDPSLDSLQHKTDESAATAAIWIIIIEVEIQERFHWCDWMLLVCTVCYGYSTSPRLSEVQLDFRADKERKFNSLQSQSTAINSK